MSLLTKEQLQIVNGIKAMIADYDYKTDQIRGLFDLVSIIDDLQARAHIIDCEFCDGTGGFQNEQTGEITDCRRCKGSGKHVLAPRQYTEQELREWFENRPLVQDEIDALLHEVVPGENEAWYSVLKFAAHVGALKAEPDKETKG